MLYIQYVCRAFTVLYVLYTVRISAYVAGFANIYIYIHNLCVYSVSGVWCVV